MPICEPIFNTNNYFLIRVLLYELLYATKNVIIFIFKLNLSRKYFIIDFVKVWHHDSANTIKPNITAKSVLSCLIFDKILGKYTHTLVFQGE